MPATIPAWTGTATVINTAASPGNTASFTASTGGPNVPGLLKINPGDLSGTTGATAQIPDELYQFLSQCCQNLKDGSGNAFGFWQMHTLVTLWLTAMKFRGAPEQPTQVAH